MFFVAKRKTKRKSPTKPQVRRKAKGSFWGDCLLAFLTFLHAFFLVGGLSVLASIGFDLEYSRQLKQDIIKNLPDSEAVNFVNGLNQSIAIGLVLAITGLIPLTFFFIRGIVRANRIALLLVILFEGVNIWLLLSSTKNEARFGTILPILILVYGLLRVFGAIGPKIR